MLIALITHKNCPDGSAAAVLTKKIFPDAKIFPAVHQKVDEITDKVIDKMDRNGKLFFIDIACSKPKLEKILLPLSQKEIGLEIYEHHETTKWLQYFQFPETLAKINSKIVFDQQRCGSMLFFQTYLHAHRELFAPYQNFIEATNDRDLWLKKSTVGDELALLHDALGETPYINRFLENPSLIFSPLEENMLSFIKRKEKERQRRLLENMKKNIDSEGFAYGIVFGEGESSDLLNKALDIHKLEYALLVNLNTKKVSIRGKGNMNCAEYAKRYNGGGHKCASGFRIKFDTPEF